MRSTRTISRRRFLKESSVLLAAAGWPQVSARAQQRIIRTLLRDISSDEMSPGSILFHEHLSMHYPLTNALAARQGAAAPTHFTDDVDLMIEETRAAAKDGVRCIVDGGHPDMDRNIEALKRIANESGMHIVASGGYYMQRYYPPEIASKSSDEIADDLVREAREHRLGAFGEIGQQSGELTPDERKVFTAVGKAHVRTGLPIFTHNAYTGTRVVNPPIPTDVALRQLDVLESAGVKPEHVALGHVCCLDDPTAEVAKQAARRGAFIGFDRVTIQILPDSKRVTMILALFEAGFAGNLLLSSDFSSPRSLKRNGGAGLAQTVTIFGKMLLDAGVKEETLRRILSENPRKFLSFEPKDSRE